MTLLVCRTCPRYYIPANGAFRRALDAQIAQNPAADLRSVRHVQCLGGCPEDGVAAVDGPGKARVRFNGLTADHADALVTAAQAHEPLSPVHLTSGTFRPNSPTRSAPSPTNEARSPRRQGLPTPGVLIALHG